MGQNKTEIYPSQRHMLSCVFSVDTGLKPYAEIAVFIKVISDPSSRKIFEAELREFFQDLAVSLCELLRSGVCEVYLVESEEKARQFIFKIFRIEFFRMNFLQINMLLDPLKLATLKSPVSDGISINKQIAIFLAFLY